MSWLAPPDEDAQSAARARLGAWLETLIDNPVVADVIADEVAERNRWFVRLHGEAKDAYSVWFEIDQRTVRFETYVMPAPEENNAAFFEQLLRRNDALRDVRFCVGAEQAIFLKGRFDIRQLDAEALDRVLGEIYETIERSFQSALRVGFASRMAAQTDEK